MTIPTRPAPPPPGRNQPASNLASAPSHNASSSSVTVNKFATNKKQAPPRPPPPKALATATSLIKKSGSQKSISILSNLFGASKNSSKITDKTSHTSAELKMPPKIPAPPSHLTSRHHQHQHQELQSIQPVRNDAQLINFDESPASSPPSIKKSNTGSDSMDSFCSSNSSPNNLGFNSGTTSQAESGFEDDFSVSDFKVPRSGMTTRSTTFSCDPFDCIDDFATPTNSQTFFQPPTNIRNVKPLIQAKPSIGSSSFYTSTSNIVPSPAVTNMFDDDLSNGKNLIKPAAISMPTIIKPIAANKGKVLPTHVKAAPLLIHQESASDDSFYDDLPSPPMPTMPPPPPPQFLEEDDSETCSYAIALFDYESEVVEDLNIRANDKIYLLKQMNDEWMYGRNKRGCEGIFPISYVDIRVPLKQVEPDSGMASRSASVSPAVESHRIRALYNFTAETEEDLTIKENEIVNVMYEINPEWFYGSNSIGEYGQFPSNYIEYVPQNLPIMPK